MSIAVVFPGQGSQNSEMLKVFQDNEHFTQTIKEGSKILGYNIDEICQDPEKLNNTLYTQPIMLCVSYAVWKLLISSINFKVDIGAGHSLGEYTALVANNTIGFSDGLQLVKNRAIFMSDAMKNINGSMAAVIGLEGEIVDRICKLNTNTNAIVEAVNFNCPGQTVIAGHDRAIDNIQDKLKNEGAKIVKKLPVSIAAHTSLLKEASKRLEVEFDEIKLNNDTLFDIIHNYDLSTCKVDSELTNVLCKQIHSPVRWIETLELFKDKGIKNIIEVGPGKVLSGLIKRFDKSFNIFTTNSIEDIKLIVDSL